MLAIQEEGVRLVEEEDGIGVFGLGEGSAIAFSVPPTHMDRISEARFWMSSWSRVSAR